MAFLVRAFLQWVDTQQEALSHQSILFSLLFVTIFSLFLFNRFRTQKASNLPPSPPKIPIIGHLHCLGSLPHRSLQALSYKYGPVMLLHVGQTQTLVVTSAAVAREIFKTQDAIFADRAPSLASKEFLFGGKDMVFAPDGERWRQMRKLWFDILGTKQVESYRFVREEEICKMVNKIQKSSLIGEEVNLSALLNNNTNNIVARVALSKRFDTESGKSVYAKLIEETMDLFGRLGVQDIIPSLGWIDKLTGLDKKMKTTSKALHQFIDEVIEEHLVARNGNDGRVSGRDFVDVLIDYEDSTGGVGFTRENFKGLLMNMFVAGTDTTYAVLEWAMAELASHPDVMNKLQDEIRRIVGTSSKVVESEIKHMHYLNCVIKETLRLHPPFALSLPKLSKVSTTINGYDIPAKTNVWMNLWAISRDPTIWDEPDKFIPERFVNNPVDFRGQHFEFLPFGAGRRSCPGMSFGIVSVESVLANLLYWFDWGLPGKKKIDMTEVYGLTVKLKFPLHLVATSQSCLTAVAEPGNNN